MESSFLGAGIVERRTRVDANPVTSPGHHVKCVCVIVKTRNVFSGFRGVDAVTVEEPTFKIKLAVE